jgi:hypothetical protein
VANAQGSFAPVEIAGVDQPPLPAPVITPELALPLLIEVVLRNGRVVRFPERIGARRAACLVDALDGSGS